jgi:hypothetical protein
LIIGLQTLSGGYLHNRAGAAQNVFYHHAMTTNIGQALTAREQGHSMTTLM